METDLARMAEAVATPNELQLSRQLAREKLNDRQFGRRLGAKQDSYESSLGRDGISTSTIDDGSAEGNDNASQPDDVRGDASGQAARFGQLRAQRTARRENTDGAQKAIATEQSASSVARQAYTRVWQLAEEGVQDFALSFLDLMLISGPAAVVMFIVRFVGGNLMGGSGTIRFREVSVPRIPGYPDAMTGIYNFGKVALVGFLSLLIYGVLAIIIVFIAKPELILQMGFCSFFSGLTKILGVACPV